jgi:hypothetical protein
VEADKKKNNEVSLMTTDTLPQNVSSRRLLPLSAILAEFGLHKTTVYGLIKQGKFPRPTFKAELMAGR